MGRSARPSVRPGWLHGADGNVTRSATHPCSTPDLDRIWRRLHAGERVDGYRGHEFQAWDVLSQLEPHRIWARDAGEDNWIELRQARGLRV